MALDPGKIPTDLGNMEGEECREVQGRPHGSSCAQFQILVLRDPHSLRDGSPVLPWFILPLLAPCTQIQAGSCWDVVFKMGLAETHRALTTTRVPCSVSYAGSWLPLEAPSGGFVGTEMWQSHFLCMQWEQQAQLRQLSPPGLHHHHICSKAMAFLLSSSTLKDEIIQNSPFVE